MQNATTLSAGPSPPRSNFNQCEILLFDPNAESCIETKKVLHGLGFHKLFDAHDVADVKKASFSKNYDLIIADTGGEKSPVCNLIHDLRETMSAKNPFAGVILTTKSPTPDNIRHAMNSGPDHVLSQPFTQEQVQIRINAVVDDRKPFVVTLKYVGPDRRNDDTRNSEFEQIAVPNSLRAKARNDRSAAATPDAVRAAIAQINRQKISRYDLQIGVLNELLSRSFARNDGQISRTPQFDNLLSLLDDLVVRIRETGFAQATPICKAMIQQIFEFVKNTDSAAAKIRSLKHIAMTLHICFNPGKILAKLHSKLSKPSTQSKNENLE